jgi:hypothetical protein
MFMSRKDNTIYRTLIAVFLIAVSSFITASAQEPLRTSPINTPAQIIAPIQEPIAASPLKVLPLETIPLETITPSEVKLSGWIFLGDSGDESRGLEVVPVGLYCSQDPAAPGRLDLQGLHRLEGRVRALSP